MSLDYTEEDFNRLREFGDSSPDAVKKVKKKQSPLDTQVGGDHYTAMAIQPMEYSMANNLDACQHTIIKYVTRFRDKDGIKDLQKARHTIDLLIKFEENKNDRRSQI